MKPKPGGLSPHYAAQFQDESVVAAYGTRPPYPDELIAQTLELAGRGQSRILDLGCGTGELARRLAPSSIGITAIDCSERMIAQARSLTGGDANNIRWIVGRVEDVPLGGPFSLAVAGESFHWFDWSCICEKLLQSVPSSLLVLADRCEVRSAWSDRLAFLIAKFSTNRDFEPYELVEELVSRSCFLVEGLAPIGPHAFRQSVDDYISSLHSRNGLSLERMSPRAALQFDAAVREAVAPHAEGHSLVVQVETRVAWGHVLSPS